MSSQDLHVATANSSASVEAAFLPAPAYTMPIDRLLSAAGGVSVIGWPVPLLAIQILWIKLVTDGLPALALGTEPPERDIMSRAPRPPHEAVITREHGLLILFHGTLIAAVAGLGFWLIYQGDEMQLNRARAVAFCVTAFAQLFFAIGCRSQRFTMPELGLFSNPHLFGAIVISGLLQLSVVTLPVARPVFEVGTHLSLEWLLIGVLSLTPVTIIEITKLLRSALRDRSSHQGRYSGGF